jgi:hypothetical protein
LFGDTRGVREYVVISKAHNAVALTDKPLGTFKIMQLSVRQVVSRAVDLDHQ